MTVKEKIIQNLEELPPSKLLEVLDFVESLAGTQPKRPLRSPLGLWKDQPDISAEEIDELRREMWGSFPRDIPA